MNDPSPDENDETLWGKASRRADAIRGFLESRSGGATASVVAGLVAELLAGRQHTD